MVASKKKAAKSSKKKAPAKAAGKATIQFSLDAERVAAIKRCLAKGSLKIVVNKVDLARGRVRDPWLYD